MIELKPGDIFVSENPSSILSFFIKKAQKVLAFDGKAIYGHAGLIVNSQGKTFESGIKIPNCRGYRIGFSNMEMYSGFNIKIIRHEKLDYLSFENAFIPLLREYYRKRYPMWRLPLFLVPILARKLHFTNLGVCSEVVAKLLYNAGLLPEWRSVFPDMISDWGHPIWGKKGMNIIWEGVVE